MKKTTKIAAILMMSMALLITLTACMEVINMMPDGLEQAMADFEPLDVEVRLFTYAPPQNSIIVELTVKGNREDITCDPILLLLFALDDYFENEQFINYMLNFDPDINYRNLGIGYLLFDTDGERIRLGDICPSSSWYPRPPRPE